MTRADELVALLGLQPHREGGFYRELFRSNVQVDARDGRPLRAAVTTIYYLLPAGQFSRWHRVRSDEIWHLYEGGPLEVLVAPPDFGSVERRRLDCPGKDVGPVTTVPADWWQAARPLGAYALAGCTVGPGFEFADFSVVHDDPAAAAALEKLPEEYRALA